MSRAGWSRKRRRKGSPFASLWLARWCPLWWSRRSGDKGKLNATQNGSQEVGENLGAPAGFASKPLHLADHAREGKDNAAQGQGIEALCRTRNHAGEASARIGFGG